MGNQPAIDFKANYENFLHHKPNAFVPNSFVGNKTMGFGAINGPAIEKGNQFGDGLDAFGNKWEYPASGAGAAVPDCTVIPLDDICQWKEKIAIPDPSAYDWKADYEKECQMMGAPNREAEIVDFGFGNGVFERLAALLGFEEALVAMVMEPEAVNDLFTAITDYKIESLDYIIDAYHPETITYYDDIATEKDLFMSPETYRSLIKPHHKRFADACRERGLIPIYHCCGHAEALVEDFIECGWAVWQSVQVSNDLEYLIKSYGNRLGFIGGFDSNGAPAREDASPEEVEAEVVRCIDTYGKYHQGYCFFGFRYVNTLDPSVFMEAMAPIGQKATEYALELYAAGK